MRKSTKVLAVLALSSFALVWMVVTLFLYQQAFYRTAYPALSVGHRVYGVTNAQAAKVLDRAFREIGHLRKDKAFAAGPTRQIMYYDGTVLNLLDAKSYTLKQLPRADKQHPDALLQDMPSTGASLVNDNPWAAAQLIIGWLREAGFQAEIAPLQIQEFPAEAFVFIRSNAFDNDRWTLLIRWHEFDLGGPPEAINFP